MRWSWECSQCLSEATKLWGEDVGQVSAGWCMEQAGWASVLLLLPHAPSFPGCCDPWFLTSPSTVLPFTSFAHLLLAGGTKRGGVSLSVFKPTLIKA